VLDRFIPIVVKQLNTLCETISNSNCSPSKYNKFKTTHGTIKWKIKFFYGDEGVSVVMAEWKSQMATFYLSSFPLLELGVGRSCWRCGIISPSLLTCIGCRVELRPHCLHDLPIQMPCPLYKVQRKFGVAVLDM